MRFELSIPARINILGNPTDANEGDYATISTAVNICARAVIEPADHLVIEMKGAITDRSKPEVLIEEHTQSFPLPYTGNLDLIKGAFNQLHSYSAEFREKIAHSGNKITTWSDVPRQSGLGGSSLFVLLTLAGLRDFYELNDRTHNDYILAELAQRVEALELGITCGYADRYVPLFGGIAYLDYRGKLFQNDIKQEPFATYERLDNHVQDFPLIAFSYHSWSRFGCLDQCSVTSLNPLSGAPSRNWKNLH